MKLLEISMETYFKTLDGKKWVQEDGCPIGKLISGEIAEIYMNWFEETFVFSEENDFKPRFWKRMRDGIFWYGRKGTLKQIGNLEAMNLIDFFGS